MRRNLVYYFCHHVFGIPGKYPVLIVVLRTAVHLPIPPKQLADNDNSGNISYRPPRAGIALFWWDPT